MDLQPLFGDFPIERFVEEYYHHLPYSARGLAAPLLPLGDWNAFFRIVAQESSDVLVCRRNEQWHGAPPRSAAEATSLLNQGHTLLVRHAERHDERLAELAADFACNFAAPVNIHVYCTPAGEFGFGWHYDAEEVFLVQTTGRKEYSLRKNTVHPWPLLETLPADMHFEREIMPVMRCELAAGDWLYVPSGYWHMGRSQETAISLAIGIQPHAAIEVFDFLRRQLVQSIFWRQRLPVTGIAAKKSTDELRAAYERKFHEIGRELASVLASPQQAHAFLKECEQPYVLTSDIGRRL